MRCKESNQTNKRTNKKLNCCFEIADTSQSVDSLAGELEKHIQLLEEQREKCKDLEKEKNEDKLTFDQVCTRKFKIY